MTATREGMKLSFLEKFGYGLGDTASNFVWALMMNFIMYYYTDIFGITAAAAGTMLLFARSTDGFFDFFVGAVADRTQSRWGRFRPWLLWLLHCEELLWPILGRERVHARVHPTRCGHRSERHMQHLVPEHVPPDRLGPCLTP